MTDWTWLNAQILRAVDGDTLIVLLTRDIGFHGSVSFSQRVRLEGIDAAPLATSAGKAAAAFVASWIGLSLTIVTSKAYKYGDEWMATITSPAGVDLAGALVTANLAMPWDGHGPRPA